MGNVNLVELCKQVGMLPNAGVQNVIMEQDWKQN